MKSLLFSLYLILISSVVVEGQVTAEITSQDSNFCEGEQIMFTAKVNAGSIYKWYFGEYFGYSSTTVPSIYHQYYTPGTYILKLVVDDNMGNVDSTEKIIRVRSYTNARFSIDQYAPNDVYCISTEFTISSWSQMGGFDSLSWDFGDGFTSGIRSPKHQYSTPGSYDIYLRAIGFCGTDSFTKKVTVVADERAKPQASFYVNPQVICPGKAVSISASNQSTPIDSLRVFLGDGRSTPLDDFSYHYNQPGTYQVQLMTHSACGSDTVETNIVVADSFDHQPSLNFTSQPVCTGQDVYFYVGGASVTMAYLSYGDGTYDTLDQEKSGTYHAYAMKDTFDVEAIIHYDCGNPDTIKREIIINDGRMVNFFRMGTSKSQMCPNEEIFIHGPYLEKGDSLYVWFGDGKMASYGYGHDQINYTYNTEGIYTIKGVKRNACGFADSSITSVNVLSSASGNLVISSGFGTDDLPKCIGDSTFFYLSSPFGLKNPMFHLPGGSSYSGDMVGTTFSAPGEYLVTATATDFCGTEMKSALKFDITDRMMTPALNFYFYPLTQCVNDIFFFDVFGSGIASLFWDFDDGTTMFSDPNLPHVMHAYTNAGTYNAEITATNGCGVTKANPVLEVESAPNVDFTASALNGFVGDTILFTMPSNGARQAFWVFNLDLNDTASSRTVSRIYDKAGTFKVTLFAENDFGCWDTLSKEVTIGVVGVSNVGQKSVFQAYPNPASNMLTVEYDTKVLSGQIYLLDVAGRVVLQSELKTSGVSKLDLTGVKNGIYFIKMVAGNESFSGRIVVSH